MASPTQKEAQRLLSLGAPELRRTSSGLAVFVDGVQMSNPNNFQENIQLIEELFGRDFQEVSSGFDEGLTTLDDFELDDLAAGLAAEEDAEDAALDEILTDPETGLEFDPFFSGGDQQPTVDTISDQLAGITGSGTTQDPFVQDAQPETGQDQISSGGSAGGGGTTSGGNTTSFQDIVDQINSLSAGDFDISSGDIVGGFGNNPDGFGTTVVIRNNTLSDQLTARLDELQANITETPNLADVLNNLFSSKFGNEDLGLAQSFQRFERLRKQGRGTASTRVSNPFAPQAALERTELGGL